MMRTLLVEDVVVDHVVVVAERTVDDPTLFRHQRVDVFEESVGGHVEANAILDVDVFVVVVVVVVVAILPIEGVSIFVVDIFDCCCCGRRCRSIFSCRCC